MSWYGNGIKVYAYTSVIFSRTTIAVFSVRNPKCISIWQFCDVSTSRLALYTHHTMRRQDRRRRSFDVPRTSFFVSGRKWTGDIADVMTVIQERNRYLIYTCRPLWTSFKRFGSCHKPLRQREAPAWLLLPENSLFRNGNFRKTNYKDEMKIQLSVWIFN